MINNVNELTIEIYADTANEKSIRELSKNPLIKGFTTNPALMRKAGIEEYESFARHIVKLINGKPISFEVIADDFATMEEQAHRIASWGSNVYVKIPITTTQGQFSTPLIKRLAHDHILMNITVVFTLDQVQEIISCFNKHTPAIISILAGRIADTGVDPLPLMRRVLETIEHLPNVKLLWASTRELINIVQANNVGCHIVTVTEDILSKLPLMGKDLKDYSLDTVQMLHQEAQTACYCLGETVEA